MLFAEYHFHDFSIIVQPESIYSHKHEIGTLCQTSKWIPHLKQTAKLRSKQKIIYSETINIFVIYSVKNFIVKMVKATCLCVFEKKYNREIMEYSIIKRDL